MSPITGPSACGFTASGPSQPPINIGTIKAAATFDKAQRAAPAVAHTFTSPCSAAPKLLHIPRFSNYPSCSLPGWVQSKKIINPFPSLVAKKCSETADSVLCLRTFPRFLSVVDVQKGESGWVMGSSAGVQHQCPGGGGD